MYQTSSSNLIPYTFKEICERMTEKKIWMGAPFLKNLLPPKCYYTQHRYLYMFLVFTLQILPALLADLLLKLFGKPPAIMAINRKCFTTLEVMQPFLFNNYESSGISDMDGMIAATVK